MERCIENMQLNNNLKTKTKIANVDLKKREICVSTEKAVQEIKTFVDDAYAGWNTKDLNRPMKILSEF